MNKLTDNETIKALECCLQEYGNCDDCPYKEYQCVSEKYGNVFYKDILDLINRQKAEIEELKADKIIAERHEKDARILLKETVVQLETAKSEAIKEYHEKVKQALIKKGFYLAIVKNVLEEVEKEMVGENDV